ncbi:hypothetical protein AVEN_169746-1 [Araneus ventricosus]|uniref:Uncharacterized protein n=1 Tax=Araneus ventricosus TaxID=182803 RepID=A0A4Y2N1P1_ARAVE|nr:hypothetical protein AVEN_169746-1 [Araneus ventricosus]
MVHRGDHVLRPPENSRPWYQHLQRVAISYHTPEGRDHCYLTLREIAEPLLSHLQRVARLSHSRGSRPWIIRTSEFADHVITPQRVATIVITSREFRHCITSESRRPWYTLVRFFTPQRVATMVITPPEEFATMRFTHLRGPGAHKTIVIHTSRVATIVHGSHLSHLQRSRP